MANFGLDIYPAFFFLNGIPQKKTNLPMLSVHIDLINSFSQWLETITSFKLRYRLDFFFFLIILIIIYLSSILLS